jgi:dephospho-CoA kinase
MKRVLVTGMSGVGKSSVAERLSAHGYTAVDTSYGGFSIADEHGILHWDLERIRHLLATEDTDMLFVVGTDERQGMFSDDFDLVILLTAPREVIIERLGSRTNNPFGKEPEELAKVLADIERFEPPMRRWANHVIDTDQPLDLVVEEILRLADG